MSNFPTRIIVKSLAKEFSNMEYPQIQAFCQLILSNSFNGDDLDKQSDFYAQKIATCKPNELEEILIRLYEEAT